MLVLSLSLPPPPIPSPWSHLFSGSQHICKTHVWEVEGLWSPFLSCSSSTRLSSPKGRAWVIIVSARLLQTRFQMQTEHLHVKTPALLFIYILKKLIKNMFMVSILKYLHDYLQITPPPALIVNLPIAFPGGSQ